jgi:hypothetical protein
MHQGFTTGNREATTGHLKEISIFKHFFSQRFKIISGATYLLQRTGRAHIDTFKALGALVTQDMSRYRQINCLFRTSTHTVTAFDALFSIE